MSRVLVIGDIHGGLKALTQVLKRAKVNTKDHLIFLGDYVDGWSDSANVISFLIEFALQHNCTFIRGNHDDLVQQWLHSDTVNPMWFQHGGKTTLEAYNALSKTTIETHKQFYKQLKTFYIDAKNRLFIHAGFTNLHGPQFEYFKPMCYWDRTLWEMVVAMPKDAAKESHRYPKRLQLFSEIFIGHTPTQGIDSDCPVNFQNVWNIDTGAAFRGTISILDVDTKDVWQSDNVMSFYPNEKGRN